MINEEIPDVLFDTLIDKALLKQKVYDNTFSTFQKFKIIIKDKVNEYKKRCKKITNRVPFEYKDKSDFEIELKFAGDILIFMMHTNIFEFPRAHEVMKTPYVKEDKERSYCGVINIYNFLSDSFKYNRVNDIGYLIGRVFINKDKHYFIEGKKEIGLLYNSFGNAIMNESAIKEILKSSIEYTINFDLLTPQYDNVKEVTVSEMQTTLNNMQIKTAKRLGFKFQSDHEEIKTKSMY